MRAAVVLCAILGHRFRTVEDPLEIEPVLLCSRCGHRTIAPNATGFDVRIGVRTGEDNALGPGPGR